MTRSCSSLQREARCGFNFHFKPAQRASIPISTERDLILGSTHTRSWCAAVSPPFVAASTWHLASRTAVTCYEAVEAMCEASRAGRGTDRQAHTAWREIDAGNTSWSMLFRKVGTSGATSNRTVVTRITLRSRTVLNRLDSPLVGYLAELGSDGRGGGREAGACRLCCESVNRDTNCA